MKHYVQSLSFAILLSLFTSHAGAQIHGLAIDLGKTHKEDTTHVTNFSIGVNSSTDTLKGVQLNMLSNYARDVQGLQLAGFTNISCDLMLGVPGQKEEDLYEDAKTLIDAGAKHISMYSLMIEEGTPYEKMYGGKE